LEDLTFPIDQGSDFLGVLAVQVGQQPRQVEGHGALAGLGRKRVLIGYREVAQALNHVVEDSGGNDAITQ